MDLSNREAATHWYKMACDEPDRDLRKQALATHKKYLKMAEKEERLRLRLLNPGYGVKSMFVWIVMVSLVALAVILLLSKAFPIATVCTVFGLIFVLFIGASAITLRVYGHITPATMLDMVKLGLDKLPALGGHTSVIDAKASADDSASHPQQQLPQSVDVPHITFQEDDK